MASRYTSATPHNAPPAHASWCSLQLVSPAMLAQQLAGRYRHMAGPAQHMLSSNSMASTPRCCTKAWRHAASMSSPEVQGEGQGWKNIHQAWVGERRRECVENAVYKRLAKSACVVACEQLTGSCTHRRAAAGPRRRSKPPAGASGVIERASTSTTCSDKGSPLAGARAGGCSRAISVS